MNPSHQADMALIKSLEQWEQQGLTPRDMLGAMRGFINDVEQRATRQAVVET